MDLKKVLKRFGGQERALKAPYFLGAKRDGTFRRLEKTEWKRKNLIRMGVDPDHTYGWRRC